MEREPLPKLSDIMRPAKLSDIMRPAKLSDIISESRSERRARHRVQRELAAATETGSPATPADAAVRRRRAQRIGQAVVVFVLVLGFMAARPGALIDQAGRAWQEVTAVAETDPPSVARGWLDTQVATVNGTGSFAAMVPPGAWMVRVSSDERVLLWGRADGWCWAADVQITDAGPLVDSGRSTADCSFADAMDALGNDPWHNS